MDEDFKDIFGDWVPGSDPSGGRELPPGEPENRGERRLNEKEVSVVGVYEHVDADSAASPQVFVLLQDRRGRKVRIWIGRYEAFAISTALEHEQLDRPMTHDLIRIVLERTGAVIDCVIVDDLWQETFYAKLNLTSHGKHIEVDCRPSDAIAVALRTKSPIYVAESVFEAVSDQS